MVQTDNEEIEKVKDIVKEAFTKNEAQSRERVYGAIVRELRLEYTRHVDMPMGIVEIFFDVLKPLYKYSIRWGDAYTVFRKVYFIRQREGS
jgi:hypothetical protein